MMTPQQVSALSREKKVEEAILRSVKLLPGDVGAELKALLSPTSLAFMVATLVGLAAAQAFGIGEFADALLLIAAIGFCGWGAVDGCKDLYHFVKTALDARSDQDLDRAAQYFASAIVKIGVTAVMAFLLKKPLKNFRDAGGIKRFRTMNYKPSLEWSDPPPPRGTPLTTEYKPLSNSMGVTDDYGNITIDSSLSAAEAKITLDHELVHRFFSAKFGPFRQLRASIAISGYLRSAMLRYLEEAMAEGYAQLRAQGVRNLDQVIKDGLAFPLKGKRPYISIQQRGAVRGQILGTIVVNGMIMTVSIEHDGGAPASAQQKDQHARQPAAAPAH